MAGSYKYRNGSTPDHVDDSDSDSTSQAQHGLGDDPKKPAPVDTVSLKKSMDSTVKASDINSYLSRNGSDQKTKDDARGRFKDDVANLRMQAITLNDARAGKIPAKGK